MNRIPVSALALLLPLVACTTQSARPSPTTFGKNYAATFPAPPSCEATVQEAPGVRMPGERCSYLDEKLAQGLSAEFMTFPNAIPSHVTAEHVLIAAAQGAAATSDSHLVSQRSLLVGAYPALDVTFYPNAKGFVAFARYVLVGSDLIMVTADGFKTTTAPDNITAFFASLTIRQ